MLYQWIRLLNSDNGVISDLSIDNQDESVNIPIDIEPLEDWHYLGQHYPFNNFLQQVENANSVVSSIEIQYWTGSGNEWKNAVDVLDGTSRSGVACARSGVVQFSPQSGYSWHNVSDTKDETEPLGLEDVNITNIYWMRYRWTNKLTVGATLKRVVYAFTRTQQIDALDTQVNEFMDSFKSGKTDWDDEIVTASIQVVNDLKRRGLIVHQGEILRFDDVTMATDLRTLILIYKNLGPGYKDKLDAAWVEYTNMSSLGRFSFDQNQNAFMDKQEIQNKVGKLVR